MLTSIEDCNALLLDHLRRLAYRQGTFTLASGKKSDFYIDCRDIVLSAHGHILVGRCIEHLVRTYFSSAVAVGGMSIGANPLASATACVSQLMHGQTTERKAPLHAFYVRKEPKGHGTQNYIEGLGNLIKADRPRSVSVDVVIVEDVVTTGASTKRAIERVRAAGLSPIGIVALVDREEGGIAHLAQFAPVKSLYTRSDFVNQLTRGSGK